MKNQLSHCHIDNNTASIQCTTYELIQNKMVQIRSKEYQNLKKEFYDEKNKMREILNEGGCFLYMNNPVMRETAKLMKRYLSCLEKMNKCKARMNQIEKEINQLIKR